jgi:hypothetical protein
MQMDSTPTCAPRQCKPLSPVQVQGHFIGGATAEDLTRGAAILEIIDAKEMTSYWCAAVTDRGRIVSFRLRKFVTGDQYDLPADLSACDCPDGVYRSERPLGCRHRVGLRQAIITAADGLPAGALPD